MLKELNQNVSQWTAKYKKKKKKKNPGSDIGEASCMQGIFFCLFLSPQVPSDSLFEPAVIDGRCALDRAKIGWPRARFSSYPIVSHR